MEHYKHLLSEQFEREGAEALERMLDKERSRPLAQQDLDKIAQITEAYAALTGQTEALEEAAARGIAALEAKPQTHPPIRRRMRLLLIAAAAALLLLVGNVFTVAAYQKDVFSVIIEYTKDGFSVKYPDTIVELPTSPEDPYGIKTECAKYGMDVLAPTYLPEGFVLSEVTHEKMDDYCEYIDFHFYLKNKAIIQFTYTQWEQQEYGMSIPSDEFNLSEIDINGIPAILSKEDGQYTVLFRDGNLETMITSNYGYEECEDIIVSLN